MSHYSVCLSVKENFAQRPGLCKIYTETHRYFITLRYFFINLRQLPQKLLLMEQYPRRSLLARFHAFSPMTGPLPGVNSCAMDEYRSGIVSTKRDITFSMPSGTA